MTKSNNLNHSTQWWKATAILVAVMVLTIVGANAQFSSVACTGYNADVVADGVGLPSASTTHDVDGVNWVFVSSTFNPAGTICASGATAMPASNTISSLTTSGLVYNLQPYNAPNSLRSSGTLTLTTPTQAANIYLLALGGSGASSITATINFSDLTNQVITGSAPDWCSATGAATTVFYRILRTTSHLH